MKKFLLKYIIYKKIYYQRGEETMRRKRGIPLVALVIFIALLVAIILTCVIILGTNKDKINTQPENIAVNQTPEETNTKKSHQKI